MKTARQAAPAEIGVNAQTLEPRLSGREHCQLVEGHDTPRSLLLRHQKAPCRIGQPVVEDILDIVPEVPSMGRHAKHFRLVLRPNIANYIFT
jgi:hypothetical protein